MRGIGGESSAAVRSTPGAVFRGGGALSLSLSSPHIIIHDEVSKSERDGFPIDLSSLAGAALLPTSSALADAYLIVL